MPDIYSIIPPLLEWYRREGRPLPWREEATPYHVWISEIMLQQTRIEAAIPYYYRFLEALPDVRALAAVDDDLLMKLWEGLGYYSRARNLKKAAIRIVEDHGGELPADVEALRALPGIGDYTAGAIASIAFGLPAPAVDGNVLRVLSRLFADRRDILSEKVKREAIATLAPAYPRIPEDASALTQALMELGEVLCIPNGKPHCKACPLADLCEARKQNITEELPFRSPRPERTVEERTLLLLIAGDCVALTRRPPHGLLAGMWEFPALEGHLKEEEVRSHLAALGIRPAALERGPAAKHVFTHREWRMRTFIVTLDSPQGNYTYATAKELDRDYALPTAFRTPLATVRERLSIL